MSAVGVIVNGAAGARGLLERAMNAGDSSILYLTHRPSATSTIDPRKGNLQAHSPKACAPNRPCTEMMVSAASTLAAGPPIIGKLTQKPLCFVGMDSATSVNAPVASPPTATPCRMRQTTRSSGAITPAEW